MERFFRNLRVFGTVMGAIFVLIAVLTGVLYLFREHFPFALPAFSPAVSGEERQPDESSSENEENNETEEKAPLKAQQGESSSEEKEGEEEGFEPSEEKEPAPEEKAAPAGSRPNPMHAVYLQPGVDYPIKGEEAAIRAGIEEALEEAQRLGMNTIIARLYGEEGAVYQTKEVSPANREIDILDLLSSKTRARGMYFYVLYEAAAFSGEDGIQFPSSLDMAQIDFAYRNAWEFFGRYSVDGLLIDRYGNEPSASSYARYIHSGTGVGYQNYMRSFSESLCLTVLEAARLQSPAVRAGLMVDGVWENDSVNPEGSPTSQSVTSLSSQNIDTRKLALEGGFDFIAMRTNGSTDSAEEPFRQTAAWWDAQARQAGVPLYILHPSDKICTDAPGYQSPDELVQQIIYARECAQYEGSLFNNLSRLRENPQSSTDLLVALFENRVNVSHVLTELAVSTPEETTFSTFEPLMVFRGASDPNFAVTLNGQALDTDADGYFTTNEQLQPGENVFTFTHKGKSLVYRITRNVQIIQEVSPTGSVEADGGMRLQVSALAHNDAAVSATLGGMTISLTREAENDDDTDHSSSYSKFTGEFTLPAASASQQSLGAVTVYGEWQGISDSMQGAQVTIKKVVAAGDGDLIIVTADSAKTFPVDVLNNESNPAFFPLPRGTKDYAIGDVLSFTNSSGSYRYYQLQSGVRVYAEDVSKAEGDLAAGNAIRGMKISSDTGYTYVRLATDQPVPYLVTYRSDGITFDFQYTSSTPSSLQVPDNPVIRSADWSGSQLTLSFTKPGSFLGYYAYYEGDTLVLRLTNPPTKLGNVRVAIDPGHGGKDRGASGYYPEMDEKDVNLAIAQKTADALEALGMKVKLIQTDPYLTLTQRIEQARSFDADIFLSIHSNSSVDAAARGTEAYYFYPNGQLLASEISRRVAGALDTVNRGGKAGRYIVTTDSRFASVLIESGFISNKNEYKQLTSSSVQQQIADGIAEGVRAYIGAISTGIAGGQGEEIGDDWEESDRDSEEQSGQQSALVLKETNLSLSVGEGYQLAAQAFGEVQEEEILWESEDEKVVTIDSSGYMEAVGEGSCTVTASVLDGKYKAACEVEVTADEGEEEKISFSQSVFTLQTGEGFQLTPETGPDRDKLQYRSSDEAVVTIDADGWVDAVGEGEATIEVWADKEEEKQQLSVTVSPVS